MRGAIFGKTRKSAEAKLQKIISDYEFYEIASVVTKTFTKNHCEVTFSNGDYWRTFHPAQSARGYRFNVVYIDAALVENNDALEYAQCAACAPPYQAIRFYYYGQDWLEDVE